MGINLIRNDMFKVLMYKGIYINPNLLHDGIYETERPAMYSLATTIESLEENGREINRFTPMSNIVGESFFENLKKCELVEVSIIGAHKHNVPQVKTSLIIECLEASGMDSCDLTK